MSEDFICKTIKNQMVVVILLISISSSLYKWSCDEFEEDNLVKMIFCNSEPHKVKTLLESVCENVKILSEHVIGILANLLDIFDLFKIFDLEIKEYWYKILLIG
jgi:hypothetical protein